MTTYLSCANTAKLIRAALKESFPGVKFSVRSSVYAGGASIRIGWVDGPTGAQVETVASAFKGAYFDAMIDYKGSRYHELDGQPVRFGADFVFAERRNSKALAEKIAARLNLIGWKTTVSGSDAYGWHVDGSSGNVYHCPPYIQERAEAARCELVPMRYSPTLARIKFAGDDGYGQGTVGRPGSDEGGEQAYKAQEAARERAKILPELVS